MYPESFPAPQVTLRDATFCRSELKAFAELLRISQHDFHGFQDVEEVEEEVLRAVNSFNSLSDAVGYEPVDVNQVNALIIDSVRKDWFKKARTHKHGILKLDQCIYPMVQIEPQRYILPNKDSLVKGAVPNDIQDGLLLIGKNSSAVLRFGRKISSLDGEVMQLSPEEIEFIGNMHVNWVNRIIGEEETITVLEVSHNTSSRNLVMYKQKSDLYAKTCLKPVPETITRPSKFNTEGLSDIILTYFILGSELHHVDSNAAIARTVELADKAVSAQQEGQVSDLNPSVYFRGLEDLASANKGFCAYLLAISDRSRRAELPPAWSPTVNEKTLPPSDYYLASYDESQITIRHQWPWATYFTFGIGAAAVITLAVVKAKAFLQELPDYITLFIFLLLGTTATVHNIWYAQWPLHDAVRGIVTSNNTEKLERFLGKEKFVRTIMSIKRPDVVFDDHKSCLLAPARKGKVILHRMIKYGEVRKYGVSILFNNYFEPVFTKGNVFREVTIQNEVVHVGAVIPAQDLISREVPADYEIGLDLGSEENV